jgi:glucose/arabinose dehydrogenase
MTITTTEFRLPAAVRLVEIAAALCIVTSALAQAQAPQDPFLQPYRENCSVCHGENLEGAAQGTPLVGVELKHGDSIAALTKSISDGIAQTPMPAWSATLDATRVQRLAIFISEKRANFSYTDFKVGEPPPVPEGKIASERHAFRVETVATDLDRLPYSIAPLPDGRLLVTEKTRGLRIVSKSGEKSELIRGTPQAYDDGFAIPGLKIVYGMGYLLDVRLAPDYAKSGWIYLSYTDRCSDCNAASRQSKRPVSMNALVRGRIKDGAWVDQQTIWKTDVENYTGMPDMAAGGRIAFDGKGHVFLSVGIKDNSEFAGVQDLALPYGKILRVNEDGSIPKDNPFVGKAGVLPSIWTYGQRSPEGLEFNARTGQLWETEMGQRGGDEVNLLLAGKNYGWPLVSKGLKYDGTPVDYGKTLGIEPDLNAIQEPVVDFTPSPAISSFVFYDGKAFPRWQRNMLVGSLKATELYRVVVDGNKLVHVETLLNGLGRIRDVAVGADGFVYLLLEHASGGRIVRLVPAA